MTPAVAIHLTWGALRSLALGAWRSGRGRDAFLGSFTPEGLSAVDEQGRRVAARAGDCLGCGACEELGRSPRTVLEASRRLDRLADLETSIRALDGLDREEIGRLELACPASVPFAGISGSLGRMLDRGPKLG